MLPDLNWLENPEIFRVNRLDAHSDHVCFASPEETESSLRQDLNGQWRFAFSENPAARPAQFWQEGYDLSAFGTITVPGHIQTQGYGQIQYTNKLYPWDGHAELRPPHIDWERNPVGSYVREFDLDAGLKGRDIRVSFQGVEAACFVWCNGSFVGYSEDSFTPADFDLTPYIKEKGNRLYVEVYQRCSGSWLEDQDFFRFSGIFRPVFLYAKPIVEDLWIQSTLHEDLVSGDIRFRLKLTEPAKVHAKISHKADGILFDGDLELTCEGGYSFSQTIAFPNVRIWDYGSPELYQVMLTVVGDEITEYIPYDTGFRRFVMGDDKVMYLNGKRLLINGVNRHEWNVKKGRAVDIADMEEAMETIEANHINAVRTCHYPNRTEWYHMCDRKGIYLMDETNLETHGSWQKDALPDSIEPSWNIPGSLPQWRENVLDRAKSMFERDKNHVSILFWSCGNEAFCGENVVAMAEYFRSVDPSRLVHYESVYFTRGVANGQPTSPFWKPRWEESSDMESRMYATPWDIREYLENDPPKPYISCEYMHNMGNSLGGMESYVNLCREFPLYQGGFIWDFMDQAMVYTNPNGQQVLGYGGDFGDRQADYNFSGNGIVDAFGNPKPCMQEVRYWHDTPENRKLWDENNAQILRQMEENLAADQPVLDMMCRMAPELKIVHGDGNLGVRGKDFEILFSHAQAGPASVRKGNVEWMWRGPRPAYWRAPTENDLGCGFPGKSAIWSAVETHQKCIGREVLEESGHRFTIRYTFSADVMPDLRTHVTYSVDRLGRMDVTVHYHGGENRPQLPLLGLRFATTAPVEQTTWGGLSGETYPDRYKGAKAGRFTEVPHIPNYLVPQECGNHMHTLWATFQMKGGKLGLYKIDQPFCFSAIPYTPHQLEQAFHAEELPVPTRTVITVCGAMRGVGGIDTWGSDVESAYHVHADRDIEFKFRMF